MGRGALGSDYLQASKAPGLGQTCLLGQLCEASVSLCVPICEMEPCVCPVPAHRARDLAEDRERYWKNSHVPMLWRGWEALGGELQLWGDDS